MTTRDAVREGRLTPPAAAPSADGSAASGKRKRRDLLNSARMGVREAQYELGLMYAQGIGGAPDKKEAVAWVSQAAEKGLAAAQYLLGTQCAAGFSGQKDDAAAYTWFARAADQGHARALYRLGRMQESAQPELAAAQLRRAAELGVAEAQLALARALAAGRGAAREDDAAATALRWLQQAAEQGLAAAQLELGHWHADGRGVPEDLALARRWLRKAAAQDHPAAVIALAELDRRGHGGRTAGDSRGEDGPGKGSSKSHDAGDGSPPAAGDRRRDRRRWLTAADPADADSRYHLGLLFDRGIEAPRQVEKARHWYGLAARQGDARAQAALAQLLERSGEAGDAESALGLYRQAAAGGEHEAQVALGRIHSTHDGDPAEAFQGMVWYSRAAEAGDPLALLTLAHLFTKEQAHIARHCWQRAAEQGVAQAQYMLGQLYERGTGVTADPRRAAGWYRQAAEQGDAPAQGALGLCHLHGQGVAASAREALRWLQAAADQGDAKAQWNLSALHAGGGEDVPQDLAQAFVWCRKSADQGHLAAQATLGLLHARIDQPEQAVALWTQAAEAGDAEAEYNLGLMLAKGQGCAADARGAFGWFARAAERGIRQAQSRIGLMYASGDGVPRDPIEAHKWFVIAARAGDAAAIANRKHSESLLTAEQVEEAVRRAGVWKAGRRRDL